jgi:hypothetical protein
LLRPKKNHAPPAANTKAATPAPIKAILLPPPPLLSPMSVISRGLPHSVQTKSMPVGTCTVVRASAKLQLPKLEHLPDLPDELIAALL